MGLQIVSEMQMDSTCENQQCKHFDYENNEMCMDNVQRPTPMFGASMGNERLASQAKVLDMTRWAMTSARNLIH